ncbi:MAG: hypothetical protein ACQEUG_10880 [Pseudomonadota bacterium]
MTSPLQKATPPSPAFEQLTRLHSRETSEQQHGYPFKPQRLPEAPLATPPDEALDEPDKHAAEGDDDLMSQDINAIDPHVPS